MNSCPVVYNNSFLSNLDLDPHKLILLPGAGISIMQPSCCPSGPALSEYYLSSALGGTVAEYLPTRWKTISEAVRATTGAECSAIRLESVIEKVNDVDRELGYEPMINGFAPFSRIKPNKNHFHLASLSLHGAETITPNYDNGIECAIASLTGKVPATAYDSILSMNVATISGRAIYHYHGIGDDPDDLGATVARLRQGWSQPFEDLLLNWLNNGYSVVTVGFGFTDYFNMTRFFQSFPEKTFKGSMIAFSHAPEPEEWETDPKNQAVLHTQAICGSCFKNLHQWIGDTEQFLYDLVALLLDPSVADADRTKPGNGEDREAWKTEFERIQHAPRERSFYMVRIFNQFGFFPTDKDTNTINKTGPLEGYTSFADYVNDAAKKYYEVFGSEDRLYAHLMDQELMPGLTRSIAYDFHMICQDVQVTPPAVEVINRIYRRAAAGRDEKRTNAGANVGERVSLKHIQREISRCRQHSARMIDGRYISGFNRLCYQAIAANLLLGNIGNRRIKTLKATAKEMLELHPRHYRFTSHFISVAKKYNLLSAMLGDDDQVGTDTLSQMAMEICYTDEILRIYWHQVLLCMIGMIKSENRDDEMILEWRRKAYMYQNALAVPGASKSNDERFGLIEPMISRQRKIKAWRLAGILYKGIRM